MANTSDAKAGIWLVDSGYQGMMDFLSRNRLFILVSFAVSFLILLLLAYLMVPTTYTVRASAVVDKTQSQSLFGVFSVVPQDIRIAKPVIIMQSQTFAAKVAGRLKQPLSVGVNLSDFVAITVTSDGVVNVDARASSREQAVEIANAYIEELEFQVQLILRETLSEKKAQLKSLQNHNKNSRGNTNRRDAEAGLFQSLVEFAELDMEVAAASKLVHVIDRALLENAKKAPNRVRWVLVAALFSLVFSMSAAAYLGYRRNSRPSGA